MIGCCAWGWMYPCCDDGMICGVESSGDPRISAVDVRKDSIRTASTGERGWRGGICGSWGRVIEYAARASGLSSLKYPRRGPCRRFCIGTCGRYPRDGSSLSNSGVGMGADIGGLLAWASEGYLGAFRSLSGAVRACKGACWGDRTPGLALDANLLSSKSGPASVCGARGRGTIAEGVAS